METSAAAAAAVGSRAAGVQTVSDEIRGSTSLRQHVGMNADDLEKHAPDHLHGLFPLNHAANCLPLWHSPDYSCAPLTAASRVPPPHKAKPNSCVVPPPHEILMLHYWKLQLAGKTFCSP
eukprot:1158549-Pelagomonas_calceolata.AAC.2